jgi:hypothetical protein
LAHGVIGSGGGKIEGGEPVWAKNGPKLDNPLFYQTGPTKAELTHITTKLHAIFPFSRTTTSRFLAGI